MVAGGSAWSHERDLDCYQLRNLVSDGGVPADHLDRNLVNGWGVAFNPTGFVWVANNGTGTPMFRG